MINIIRKLRGFYNKQRKLKQKLTVVQKGNLLMIDGKLRKETYKVKHLLFKSRETNEFVYKINCENHSNEFRFEVDLNEHKHLLLSSRDEPNIYDLYLLVKVSKDDLKQKELLNIEKNDDCVITDHYIEFPMRLGRFLETKVQNRDFAYIDGNKYFLRVTKKGNISLYINPNTNTNVKIQINDYKTFDHKVIFSGKIFSFGSTILDIKLSFLGRDSKVGTIVPVSYKLLEEEIKKKYGLNRYFYEVCIDFNDIFHDRKFSDDIYDLYFEIKLHDAEEIITKRVGNPKYRGWYKTNSCKAVRGNQVFAVSQYYTIKKFNLSYQIESFEKETYDYLKKLMKWSWLIRWFYWSKDIWIVGERPYKAQDTGYHFFKYMRINHPKKNVYYVIQEDSPELKNVKDYKNILFYKSKKHVKYVLIARRIFSSHHPDYLYPIRSEEFKKKVKAKKVFLQHGVMGTKNTVHFYGKYSPSFKTDLFIVSSDFEKNIIVNDFGYRPEEVVVTGLSRFDGLFRDDIKTKRQLLIIPTWREWLVEEHKFLESEYYDRYRKLVNSKQLHQLAEQYNFTIVFCLHPNMQKYTHFFKSSPVKVISQGEVNVQDLLKESAMMITDYSSVAFDFSFLNKPIVYYQFDRRKYIGPKGSHIDLDNDLPGEIATELDEILLYVKQYAENNFLMKEKYHIRASKFIKYRDTSSSKRIYEAAKKIKRKRDIYTILHSRFFIEKFNRFRKSRYYFPTMKFFYNIARRVIPIDKNLIVFESGIGKQYADSPRYIYEEIVKRGLKYKKVWVYNKNDIKFRDSNTIKVRRLSPKYYYYLAKAGYWINNQNFPTYIKKRKGTIYIQTWHGTPLKKMLFDINEIHGRSKDYVKRVSSAINNWDYLISPSPYATIAFQSAFKFKGEVLEIGYPRNDIFYKEDSNKITDQIKNKLNIPEGKKVILYAPTFRDNQFTKKNKFTFDIQLDLYKMKEKLGSEYIILVRLHLIISNKINLDERLEDFIRDVSDYPEIQELLLISDILITDYSSVMFDFVNTRRPIIFYTYDLQDYKEKLRGFYMDFENEAPGPLLSNTDEVIHAILDIENVKSEYSEKYLKFYKKYCPLEDGKATKRVVDMLLDNQ